MSAPEPRWYPDPGGAAGLSRWWDGTAWTRWLTRDERADPPTGPMPVEPGPTPSAPTVPTVRLPVAVALVAAALVVAVVAVGAVVSASAPSLPSGPAVPPPAPGPVRPVVGYDPATRTASVAELRWVLPTVPYACDADVQPRRPAFDPLLVCAAPVHEDYQGTKDWSASTGLGVLGPSLVVPGDPRATADKAFGALRSQFFGGQQTQVRELTAQRFAPAPEGTAVAVSGKVQYEIAGLPSDHDRLIVLVVALADGGYGAWFSSRPDDTPAPTLDVLDASIATLTAR